MNILRITVVFQFIGTYLVLSLFCRALLYFIATPPYRGWQRSEDLLLLHSFLSLDIFCSVLDTYIWYVCEKRLVSIGARGGALACVGRVPADQRFRP